MATDSRQRLLDLAIDYVAEHGFGDASLRQLAAGIGTSHRMLIYHFGSKEALQVAIVQAVEERTRRTVQRLVSDPTDSAADAMRRVWAELTDERNERFERLFFELYGQALQSRAGTEDLLGGIVDEWLGPFTAVRAAAGRDHDEAAADVRLSVAVIRGLLLDLLATGDRKRVDAAFERYLALVDAADELR
jgi:AcrR family transcriptional regulator